MDVSKVPYKVQTRVVTFEGDWTAEQIDSGEAGQASSVEVHEVWYEPSADGFVEVTDEARIAELEATIRGNVEGE